MTRTKPLIISQPHDEKKSTPMYDARAACRLGKEAASIFLMRVSVGRGRGLSRKKRSLMGIMHAWIRIYPVKR